MGVPWKPNILVRFPPAFLLSPPLMSYFAMRFYTLTLGSCRSEFLHPLILHTQTPLHLPKDEFGTKDHYLDPCYYLFYPLQSPPMIMSLKVLNLLTFPLLPEMGIILECSLVILTHTLKPIPKSNLPEIPIVAGAEPWNKYSTLYVSSCTTRPSCGPKLRRCCAI